MFSSGIKLALELRAFILKYGEMKKSEHRFLNAINDNIDEINNVWNDLDNHSSSLINLLNEIDIQPSVNQLHDFLLLCANSFNIFSKFTNAYIDYCLTVKNFSANEYLMTNLKNYKGMLYDYVCRVSESVTDDNTVIIDGRFVTFMNAYKDELFPSNSKRDYNIIAKEEVDKFLSDFKSKILPSIINRKPRFLFREKRILLIFEEPIKQYIEDKEKLVINIPEEDTLDFAERSSFPALYIIEELTVIEDQIKSKLPYRRRR